MKNGSFHIRLAFLFCSSIAVHFNYAQETPLTQWERAFGGNGADVLYAAQPTTDGGYVAGGFSSSGVSGNKSSAPKGAEDFWIVKLDANGNKMWDKSFGGSSVDVLYALQQTTDGGYILGGYSFSGVGADKTAPNRGSEDYWVVRLDNMGNILWDKTFGGTGSDQLRALYQTADGGFILGGTSNSGTDGNKTGINKGLNDYWVIKLDADGNIQWDKTLGGADDDQCLAVQQTTDDGFIVGGYSNSGSSADKTENSLGLYDYWVVKLDANGDRLWDNTIGGSDFDYFSSLTKTPDGGFILAGASASPISGDKTESVRSDYDYWAVKLNAAGTVEWDKTLGGTGRDHANSVQFTPDGGYILGGFSGSPISGDKTEGSFGGNDYWIVKLEATGAKMWDKTYGGAADENLISVVQSANGSYILSGYSNSGINGNKNAEPFGGYDFWLLNVCAPTTYYYDGDKDGFGDGGNAIQVCAFTAPDGYVANGDDCNDADNTIYPNAPELCDGEDNNCNGTTDEGCEPTTVNMRINDKAQYEGNSGKTGMRLRVTLSQPADRTITVQYYTENNTAAAPSDYVAKSGILTFQPGDKFKNVVVSIKGDTRVEPDETFSVVLSNPSAGVVLTRDRGIGTIINDDAATATALRTATPGSTAPAMIISPNPAGSTIQVQLIGFTGKVTLRLLDLRGKVLKTAALESSGAKSIQQQWSVGDITGGTYLLTAQDEQGNKTTKAVVVVH